LIERWLHALAKDAAMSSSVIAGAAKKYFHETIIIANKLRRKSQTTPDALGLALHEEPKCQKRTLSTTRKTLTMRP
jgi:hypothetical protein